MTKVYSITIEEDPLTGDAILPFPEEFLKELNWLEDDILNFENINNEIIITNLSLNLRKKDSV